MNVRKQINEIFQEIIDIRRKLHANPELSEKEIQTSKIISQYLKQYGIEHETEIAGHGIVAIVKGKGNRLTDQKYFTIGIRADMDALPIEEKTAVSFQSRTAGIMHACGHDIHMAVLLGTARILKELEKELSGNVKFFFEPAEETIGGAKQMIEAGCLTKPEVDAVIGLHIAPELEEGKVQFRKGKMNAASTEFEITIQGEACHGAHPEKGIDSIVAASSMIGALQSIITRNLSPTNPGVITIGQIHGGNKNNVIAKETVFSGIIRALDNHTRDYMKERVKTVSESTAEAFGAKAEVTFTDSYPALVNDEEIVSILEAAALKAMDRQDICYLREPSLGADDFSYFSQAVKSAYFNIGCLKKDEPIPQALHSGWLNPSEECVRTGMLIEVLGVMELLGQRL